MLKYSIQQKLNSITDRKKYSATLRELEEKLGIGYDAFYAIRKAKVDSDKSATGDQLRILAEHFKCTMEELHTDAVLS